MIFSVLIFDSTSITLSLAVQSIITSHVVKASKLLYERYSLTISTRTWLLIDSRRSFKPVALAWFISFIANVCLERFPTDKMSPSIINNFQTPERTNNSDTIDPIAPAPIIAYFFLITLLLNIPLFKI